jgi:hypothetical protein
MLRKEVELHGNLHDPRHPNYIHFVHIPKVVLYVVLSCCCFCCCCCCCCYIDIHVNCTFSFLFFNTHTLTKAGGTSFTKVLRRMVCTKNEATESEMDCCAVGWCDWQKGITCQNIHGCTNHIPRVGKWLNKPLPSITMMRDPVTRFISAWFYRCHNPNYDCFGVRKSFKAIRSGKSKRYSYDDYCTMPEYQNIMIKVWCQVLFWCFAYPLLSSPHPLSLLYV